MGHTEVPVKVTAWVDEGVADLVLALNQFEDVVTLDSCEGDWDQGPYVLFRCRDDGVSFAAALARTLAEHDRPIDYLLGLEWRAGDDEPLMRLTCPPQTTSALAHALNACRTTALDGGRFHKAPRS